MSLLSQSDRQKTSLLYCVESVTNRKGILYSAHPAMFNRSQKPYFDQIAAQAKLVMFGGDCYSYGLLASGYIDLVIEADLKIYDVMALIPVVEAAGEMIIDWQGRSSFGTEWDGCLVAASSQELHLQAHETVAENLTFSQN